MIRLINLYRPAPALHFPTRYITYAAEIQALPGNPWQFRGMFPAGREELRFVLMNIY